MRLKKNTVAMLLAGGQGSRLGVLTANRAKPGVTFGGKYRIIDFTLSNCTHSGIETVGVLTQYRPLELNTYIGTGSTWDLDAMYGGAYVLPPYAKEETAEWYTGTANAIFQNINFIEQFNPENILILSGDHIYKMNYKWMLDAHEKNNADATIAVIKVPIEEASRFGIMNTNEDGRIYEFEEKPENPKNNLASMGVYAFKWETIKKYLRYDKKDPDSDNDFGKDVIPAMLAGGEKLYAYEYGGYWKDVGTIQSYWDTNMELLGSSPPLNLYDGPWKIYSRNFNDPPQYLDNDSDVTNSIVCEGCNIYGTVYNSILSSGVIVEKGAVVRDSIIMNNTIISSNSEVNMTIIDEDVNVGKNCVVGEKQDPEDPEKKITVIGKAITISDGCTVEAGVEVNHDS